MFDNQSQVGRVICSHFQKKIKLNLSLIDEILINGNFKMAGIFLSNSNPGDSYAIFSFLIIPRF